MHVRKRRGRDLGKSRGLQEGERIENIGEKEGVVPSSRE